MQNINVHRYQNPKATGWAGYIEPGDKSWIMYVALDGKPLVYLHRDLETGAVLPDDPEAAAGLLAEIRAEQRRQASA